MSTRTDNTLPINPPAPCALGCMEWLGELWTGEEISDAKHVLSCVYEGVDCSLPMDRMRELEKRGLVTNIEKRPGRGRYANRYQFQWEDKLEELVVAVRTSSPNGGDEQRPH